MNLESYLKTGILNKQPKMPKKVLVKKSGLFYLVDEQKRSTLSEGRNYGMGFALAKLEDKKPTTAYPITACKDFLSEECVSEHNGKSYSIYGINTSKKNLFNNDKMYLVIGVLKMGGSTEYRNYNRDYATLAKNYKKLTKFINWFEEKFKLNGRTKIHCIEENRYVAICPVFWSEGTYRISLLTLLLRVGMFYSDIKMNPIEFLKNFKEIDGDIYYLQTALPKIEKMIDGNIPKQDLTKLTSGGCHTTGICNFEF